MNPDSNTFFWLAIALLGVAGSALFSGLETGCYCVNRIRLLVQSNAGHRSARLLRNEMDRPDRLLGTLLISNNAANYAGSLGVAALLQSSFSNQWAVIAINAVVLTPVLFVFGETIPKDLFRTNADRLTPALAPVLVAVRWIATASLLLPLVQLVGRLTRKALGAPAEGGLGGPRARMAALLKEGVRHGVLSETQTALLDRALTLRDLSVRDQMIPWRTAATIPDTWTKEHARDFSRRKNHARFPVVSRRGRVLGIIESLDLWTSDDTALRSLPHAAITVSPDDSLREALIKMRSADTAKLAIVEERGKPVGIVTLKDLIEPLTGPMRAW